MVPMAVRGPPGQLQDIVRRVARTRATTEAARNTWAEAVLYKLNDVEIFDIRTFVEHSQTVNRRLQARCSKQLHFTTMKLLLRAACDELFEEGERVGGRPVAARPLTERTAQDEEDIHMPMGFARAEAAAAAAGLVGAPENNEGEAE